MQATADEELMSRLVALNAQRATKEAGGHIRWLHPALQNPWLAPFTAATATATQAASAEQTNLAPATEDTGAGEAIELHLEGLAENHVDIPVTGTVAQHQVNPEFAGWIWAVLDVDVTRCVGKAEKINIRLPALLIRRIDDFVARRPDYRSRSGFLAQSALDRITHSA